MSETKELHFENAPIQELFFPEFESKQLRLFILRGDLIHPFVSGNKLWKLKYNLIEAARLKKRCLVTFGGAYSNHLLAVSCVASALGFKSIGILRGDEALDNPVLRQCKSFGMEFIQVSRSDYRSKETLPKHLGLETDENYILPEGGSNELAVKGCAEAVPSDHHYHHIVLPVGTGGTLAGFALGANRRITNCHVEGIAVLKGAGFLENVVQGFIPGLHNWKLHLDHHGGGYGKIPSNLEIFMQRFTSESGIMLEPIYTGKMMHAVFQLALENYFSPGRSILCIHTGGLYLASMAKNNGR